MTGSKDTAWVFADFVPGRQLGMIPVTVDTSRLSLWQQIYGPMAPGSGVSASVLVAVMMEAYLKLIQPRPPGNIHAGQKLFFTGAQVGVGAELRVSIDCLAKILRKERRWVTFGAAIHEGELLLMRGEISTIWAA